MTMSSFLAQDTDHDVNIEARILTMSTLRPAKILTMSTFLSQDTDHDDNIEAQDTDHVNTETGQLGMIMTTTALRPGMILTMTTLRLSMMVLCESVPLSLKISSFTHITKHLGPFTRALAVTCFHSERLTPTERLSALCGLGLSVLTWDIRRERGLPRPVMHNTET